MGVGVDLHMYDAVVKKFTFAISSPGEFLYILTALCFLCRRFISERERYVNSRSRSLFAVARPSVCLSSVCRLSSVMLVHPPQAVVIFGNLSTAFGTLAILDMHRKFYGDCPRGTSPLGELNPRGVAKYSDFGPIEGYISEMGQDTR